MRCPFFLRGQRPVLLFLYAVLGFVWRVPAFAVLRLMQDYGISVANVSAWNVVLMLPWMLKPFFGITSDNFPIFGKHRVPYIIVNNVLATLFSLLQLIPYLGHDDFLSFLFFVSFWGCWADVLYDALMTYHSTDELAKDKGFFQCLCWSVRSVGSGIGGQVGPIMYREGGVALVFGVQGGLFLLQAVVGGYFLREPRQTPKVVDGEGSVYSTASDKRSKNRKLLHTLMRPMVYKLLLFNLISSLLPSGGKSVFYFL